MAIPSSRGSGRRRPPALLSKPPAISDAHLWTDAMPLADRDARVGFVLCGDNGCRLHGLWPNTPLLVHPCEEFLGLGIYQLFIGGELLTRWCQLEGVSMVRIDDDTHQAENPRVSMPIEEFEHRVAGLVLASIEGINKPWTSRLFAMRSVLYG